MQAFANLFAQNKNKLILTTGVPKDDQFSSPKQIRWSTALGKLLVADYTNSRHVLRNSDLSFHSKLAPGAGNQFAVDSDTVNFFCARSHGTSGWIRKYIFNFIAYVETAWIRDIRIIDASGDPSHVYVSSNSAIDGHGIRMITKSTMTVTSVGGNEVKILATGTGDNQFTNPLGILYIATDANNGFLYVCEATRICKIAVVTTAGSESFTWSTSYAIAANDLAWDGTNFYVQTATQTIKYDNVFTDATKVATACVGYSITYIPDQGDGYGATLAIVDSPNSHLERRKCSDLSAINEVGSAGDGSSSLFDPVITGPAGIWTDSEGSRYSVASGANISKNGFSGDFFRGSPNRMTYQPTGNLAAITAIDFNADAIQGEIKNLHKCVNLTSLKLQTNPALILDLGRMSAKLTTLWAYACGAGIFGSIRHMTALTSVNLRENGASQAQVDQWIGDLYANKDIMAPGTANFNGSNLVPSAGAKAQADELIATYGWTVAYS